ncbi:unnamed protein product [Linum tenue]|uniref:K Homology domain-containing protein n=1 Tax=Linum tenue TaxID=586396 RepID=A0AAV0J1T0_9ROSI|nr:unnamed protein product [Linum tenue]
MQDPRHRRGRHGAKTHRPALAYLGPGQAAFKIVCHASAVSGVIGASGSVVSQIRRETSCIVSCEELAEGAEHRVFVVVGSATPERRLLLRAAEDEQGSGEELVSDAQEAVLRVVERMWEVCRLKWRGKAVGGGGGGSNEGFCGLLVDRQQVGIVVGKGGRTITRMKSISGAHINILPAPPCALPDEQLIQITGSVLAVKRAIVVVTACLQACSPTERDPSPIPVRPIERSSSKTSFDQHLEFFPHLGSNLPPLNSADTNYSTNGDGGRREVSFRLLVSNNAVGGIIGTGGSIVKSLQNQTGACIRFAALKTWGGERVVTVSALETLECRSSPAQTATDLVFARSIESEFEKMHLSSALTDGTHVKARLILDMDHVYFLGGCNEMIDAEASKGATIGLQALEDSTTDFILEIRGEYKNVRNSLSRIIGKLRDSVFPRDMIEVATARSSKVGVSDVTSTFLKPGQGEQSGDIQENLSRGGSTTAIKTTNDPASLASPSKVSELERCMRFLLPRGVLKEVEREVPGGGSNENKPLQSHPEARNAANTSNKTFVTQGDIQLGFSDSRSTSLSGFQSARGNTVTITDSEDHSTTPTPTEHERKNMALVASETIEVRISAAAINAVYGKDGSNLDHIRKISGAKVGVLDYYPGKSMTIVISGTHVEVKVAHSLVQANILLAQ